MAKHNSGRKSDNGQNQTRKKRESQGKHTHVNKYAQHSRAAQEYEKMVVKGTNQITTRMCEYCHNPVVLASWDKHSCFDLHKCYECGAQMIKGQSGSHICPPTRGWW